MTDEPKDLSDRQRVVMKIFELGDSYSFINIDLLNFVMAVGEYPPWPQKGEGELSPEEDERYSKTLLAHVWEVYRSKPKWFFEAAQTRRQLKDKAEETARNIAALPFELQLEEKIAREVSAPGFGKRPIRSTRPPKGKVRLTVSVPASLHAKLKKVALARQTTMTNLLLGVFEKINYGVRGTWRPFADLSISQADDLERLQSIFSVDKDFTRLSMNVTFELRFKLKTEAQEQGLTLNSFIVKMIMVELFINSNNAMASESL